MEGLPSTLEATSSMNDMQQPLPPSTPPCAFKVILRMAPHMLHMACTFRWAVVEPGDGDDGCVMLVGEILQDLHVPSKKGA